MTELPLSAGIVAAAMTAYVPAIAIVVVLDVVWLIQRRLALNNVIILFCILVLLAIIRLWWASCAAYKTLYLRHTFGTTYKIKGFHCALILWSLWVLAPIHLGCALHTMLQNGGRRDLEHLLNPVLSLSTLQQLTVLDLTWFLAQCSAMNSPTYTDNPSYELDLAHGPIEESDSIFSGRLDLHGMLWQRAPSRLELDPNATSMVQSTYWEFLIPLLTICYLLQILFVVQDQLQHKSHSGVLSAASCILSLLSFVTLFVWGSIVLVFSSRTQMRSTMTLAFIAAATGQLGMLSTVAYVVLRLLSRLPTFSTIPSWQLKLARYFQYVMVFGTLLLALAWVLKVRWSIIRSKLRKIRDKIRGEEVQGAQTTVIQEQGTQFPAIQEEEIQSPGIQEEGAQTQVMQQQEQGREAATPASSRREAQATEVPSLDGAAETQRSRFNSFEPRAIFSALRKYSKQHRMSTRQRDGAIVAFCLIIMIVALLLLLLVQQTWTALTKASRIGLAVAIAILCIMITLLIAFGLIRCRQIEHPTEKFLKKPRFGTHAVLMTRKPTIPAMETFTFEHSSAYSAPRAQNFGPTGTSAPIRTDTWRSTRKGSKTKAASKAASKAPTRQATSRNLRQTDNVAEEVRQPTTKAGPGGRVDALSSPKAKRAEEEPQPESSSPGGDPSIAVKRKPTVTFALDGKASPYEESEWETTESSVRAGGAAEPSSSSSRRNSISLDGHSEGELTDRGWLWALRSVEDGKKTIRPPAKPRARVLSAIPEREDRAGCSGHGRDLGRSGGAKDTEPAAAAGDIETADIEKAK